MKRFTVMRLLCNNLEPEDAAVFVGKKLCEEAYKYDRPGSFYITDTSTSIALGLGLASTNKKRIFVVCTDTRFLSEIEVALQMGVSRCLNLIVIVVGTGDHMDVSNHPNIFKSIQTIKSFLASTGMLIQDYSAYAKHGDLEEGFRTGLPPLRGPVVVLINVEQGVKKMSKIAIDPVKLATRFKEFLNDTEE
ncbi:MAG: hypothetical protein DRP42_01485 [Tenericutes bacterium]|nr:MAG: hypothetical protein DRP42_01485 [Mycoplasmatota bacterium]